MLVFRNPQGPHTYSHFLSGGGARVGGTEQESEGVQDWGLCLLLRAPKPSPNSVSTASSLGPCWRHRSVAACQEESRHPDDKEPASMARSSSLWPAGFHQHVHLHTIHMPTGELRSQHPPLGSGALTRSHLGQLGCPTASPKGHQLGYFPTDRGKQVVGKNVPLC